MRVYNSQRRILVTGGAGFLGSHLCERLLAQGHDVLCADNFFTGTRRNVEHLLGNPHFELMRHDITFPLYVEVDQIYNLACPASPVHYQHDPVQTTKTSVHGAINMLGLAKRVRARILQASTSEVYGDPDVHPQPESYWGKVNPIGRLPVHSRSAAAPGDARVALHCHVRLRPARRCTLRAGGRVQCALAQARVHRRTQGGHRQAVTSVWVCVRLRRRAAAGSRWQAQSIRPRRRRARRLHPLRR